VQHSQYGSVLSELISNFTFKTMRITYFEAVSFWLTNFIVSESLKNRVIKDSWMKENVHPDIYIALGEYVGKYGEVNSEENKNVLGHSFYIDMFSDKTHLDYFLPKVQMDSKFECTSAVELYKEILECKLEGKEGAYVYGGLIGDAYIGPMFPSSLYYVLNKLQVSQKDLLEIFLPDRILSPKSPKTGNSRTLSTLAAVVLGYIEQLDNVKSIVISESSVGSLRWSKVLRYKMKKNEEGKYVYTYLETGLYNKSEVEAMYHRVGKNATMDIEALGTDYPFEIDGEPFYVLLREYTLGIFNGENITNLKLHLSSLRLISPNELTLK